MFRKVLIVNDDEITLFVSSKMILKTGFASEVITAGNGAKALQLFDSLLLKGKSFPGDVPELVFLDLHMPVMDGIEFLEQFSAKYAYIFPNIRFVILSSSIDPGDMNKLSKFPRVIDVMRNPINFEVLQQLKEKYAKQHFQFQPINQSSPLGQMIA